MIELIMLFRWKYEDLLFAWVFGSLCFCRHIAKEVFFIDRFFRIKKFDFFTKKTNIGSRLIGHLDLWNDKRRPAIN